MQPHDDDGEPGHVNTAEEERELVERLAAGVLRIMCGCPNCGVPGCKWPDETAEANKE